MKQKGFTLIELLVVIAIIGILAVIIILNLASATEKSRYAKVKSELKNIDDAVSIAYTDGVSLETTAMNAFRDLTDDNNGYNYKKIVDQSKTPLLGAAPVPPESFNKKWYKVMINTSTSHASLLETRSGENCVYSLGSFRTGGVGNVTASEEACEPK